jgi:hypothetical protein
MTGGERREATGASPNNLTNTATVPPGADAGTEPRNTALTVDALDVLGAVWHDAMRLSARLARESGYERGWFAGVAEERQAWNRIIGIYRDVIGSPTWVTRNELRNDPCASDCGRCSRCVRAACVARYGGDFPGRTR